MTISARTATCGVILHPAGHTRSPAMHNAAFAALGIDAVYTAFDVPPSQLAAALAGMRALGIRQLAVSIPHKQAALAHVDRIEPEAARIGAINTITAESGVGLVGSNTDWIGAVRALEAERPLAGARAVVLGAGGTARAVTYGLLARGATVCVLNRTPGKAAALADELAPLADEAAAEARISHPESGSLDSLGGRDFDVLINTTSVGLGSDASPVPASVHRAGTLVMDVVYEPEHTRFMRDAEASGARTVGGKWMLVHQAAEQIRIWTNQDAPLDTMAAAFDQQGQQGRRPR